MLCLVEQENNSLTRVIHNHFRCVDVNLQGELKTASARSAIVSHLEA